MTEPLTIGQCDSCDTRIVLAARRCPGCKVGYLDIEADIQAALASINALRADIVRKDAKIAELEAVIGLRRIGKGNKAALSDTGKGCETCQGNGWVSVYDIPPRKDGRAASGTTQPCPDCVAGSPKRFADNTCTEHPDGCPEGSHRPVEGK